jgi:CHAT domain-containing protein
LLVSLWMVNDAATAELMTYFYRILLTGVRPAAALREAQINLLSIHPHPFFWAPFVLIGRW